MIDAVKLRERTLGSSFKIEEVAGLLGVDSNKSLEIFQKLVYDCWVTPTKNGQWKVVAGDKRQEIIQANLELCEYEIRDKYELLTHLKSLKE